MCDYYLGASPTSQTTTASCEGGGASGPGFHPQYYWDGVMKKEREGKRERKRQKKGGKEGKRKKEWEVGKEGKGERGKEGEKPAKG